jgi:hypothetical protein
VLSAGGVSLYLVEVLFLSSIGLGLLRIEVGADLAKGFLTNPHLLFPVVHCGEDDGRATRENRYRYFVP